MKPRIVRYILLAAGAFALGLVGALLVLREPMEPLTEESLAAARQRWADAGIGSYDLEYRTVGGTYSLQVRDGIVTELLLNGGPTTTADPGAYSMDGLFRTLAMDLENAADQPAGAAPALLRVRFHPTQGYIERYLRSGGVGGRGAVIEDVQLTPVEGATAPQP